MKKVKFHYPEKPGGTIIFSYRENKDSEIIRYCIKDQDIINLSEDIVNALNNNTYYSSTENKIIKRIWCEELNTA